MRKQVQIRVTIHSSKYSIMSKPGWYTDEECAKMLDAAKTASSIVIPTKDNMTVVIPPGMVNQAIIEFFGIDIETPELEEYPESKGDSDENN